MNDVFLKALAERIKAEQMTVEQVPVVYRDTVIEHLDEQLLK